MRKLSTLAVLAVTTASSVALAAPKACVDKLTPWFAEVKAANTATDLPPTLDTADKSHLDCLRDEVLVIDGEGLVTCSMDAATMKPKTDDCSIDYAKAIAKALTVIGADAAQWDQLVIFGQQISKSSNPAGPLFYREGFSAGGAVDPVTMMPTRGRPASTRWRASASAPRPRA
jgi:hypothetical protein